MELISLCSTFLFLIRQQQHPITSPQVVPRMKASTVQLVVIVMEVYWGSMTLCSTIVNVQRVGSVTGGDSAWQNSVPTAAPVQKKRSHWFIESTMHYFILCMYRIFWTMQDYRCSGDGSACRGGDSLLRQPLLHETRQKRWWI